MRKENFHEYGLDMMVPVS